MLSALLNLPTKWLKRVVWRHQFRILQMYTERERESERSAYTPVTLYAKHHSIVAATICFPRRRFRSILCVLIDTQALHLLHEQQQQRPELNKKRNETTARKEQKKKMKRKLSKYNEANRGNSIE